MLLEGGSQRPWKSDEKRDSRLVFIGRGLPKERLKQEFESCRV
jgi:G3E family GTPase